MRQSKSARQRKSPILPDEPTMGDRLRFARESAELPLEAVGEALGITGSAVSQWETGKTCPSRKSLVQFAELVRRQVLCDSLRFSRREALARLPEYVCARVESVLRRVNWPRRSMRGIKTSACPSPQLDPEITATPEAMESDIVRGISFSLPTTSNQH